MRPGYLTKCLQYGGRWVTEQGIYRNNNNNRSSSAAATAPPVVESLGARWRRSITSSRQTMVPARHWEGGIRRDGAHCIGVRGGWLDLGLRWPDQEVLGATDLFCGLWAFAVLFLASLFLQYRFFLRAAVSGGDVVLAVVWAGLCWALAGEAPLGVWVELACLPLRRLLLRLGRLGTSCFESICCSWDHDRVR